MKTLGAVTWNPGTDTEWSVEEIELADPRDFEVRVKMAASGLCHSDDHVLTGILPTPGPTLGGHEGAGVVDAVGSMVRDVTVGDHVLLSFIPACGRCADCARGRSNLCEMGAHAFDPPELFEGRYRVSARDQGLTRVCGLGTFSPYVVANEASVIKIRDDIPLDKAALVGCGVSTGYGSAVRTAGTQTGDTVVVVGVGGVGINAVQGASLAGARFVIAVDPVRYKRDRATEFGASHVAESMETARDLVSELTWGRMADRVVLTVSEMHGDLLEPAMLLAGKRGVVVVTAVAPAEQRNVCLDLITLTNYEKQIRGGLFGSSNPRANIPELLDLYVDGKLKLDELITRTYRLEEINEGYADMRAGRNLRGVVVYDQ